MLQVLSPPFLTPISEVLEKDVGRPVHKDEGTFNKLCRRSPLSARLLGPNIPRPAQLGEATSPATEVEQTEPKEDAALDPMCQPTKDCMALL